MEVNSGNADRNLWARALVEAEGDETKRKAKYIQLRANQLYAANVGVLSGTSSQQTQNDISSYAGTLKRETTDSVQQIYDSPVGEWEHAWKQETSEWSSIERMIIFDEQKGKYNYQNGRIIFYATSDQGKLEGYWFQDGGGKCTNKKDGSEYWGKFTLLFNQTYTKFKGKYDECGKGPTYPWDGRRL